MAARREKINILLNSKLFDIEFYSKKYFIEKEKAVEHYLYKGWKKSYDPSLYFSTDDYLKENEYLKLLSINPLLHWELFNSDEKTRKQNWVEIIRKSNLFDENYYIKTYPDIKKAKVDPLYHYVMWGVRENRNPSKDFNSKFYIEELAKNGIEGINPLVHFFLFGREENRPTNKIMYWIDLIEKSKIFDKEYYLTIYPDVEKAKMNPIEHYVKSGAKEGRNPSLKFNTKIYLERNSDVDLNMINPLVHYILYGKAEDKESFKQVNNLFNFNKDFFVEIFNSNNNKSNEYVEYKKYKKVDTDIRLIAFYLPQFHPIPENDKAWGKGFTEWTNVSKALPQYKGHFQPRLPGELGYYDLRLLDVRKRQIELAKNYGLHGFCYHYYWFDGQKVMDKPLQMLIDNPELDFPFCINWANENWTKRWDGLDNDVILKQNHTTDDDIAFLENIKHILTDKRYIKVNGKPLLMIYRPNLFPNAKATVKLWREYAKKIGIGELYLVLTHSFDFQNPKEIGFDAATEFPPNNIPMDSVSYNQTFYNEKFYGQIYDYRKLVEQSFSYEEPEYIKFRGVCPSWDNEARKPGKGTSYLNSSPKEFEKWLDYILSYTNKHRKNEERIVFINAWNEWAEGAYLEPDRKYGYAYLDTIYKCLNKKDENKKKIVYIGHDGHFHGAQILSLNIIKTLKEFFNFDVTMILKSSGVLELEYKKYAKVYNLERESLNFESLVKRLKKEGFEYVISNTTVSGDLIGTFKTNNFNVISLIHELPTLIKSYGLEENVKEIAEFADKIIFPSTFVKDGFLTMASLDENKVIIRPQGLYQKNIYEDNIEKARIELRKELNIPTISKIVLGAGFADSRKGIDLFLDVAKKVCSKLDNVYFVWVGNIELSIKDEIEMESKNNKNMIFIPSQPDISIHYAASDLYLMTSREDPFPSVVMESMNVSVPVVGFKNAGGFQDIITENTGKLVNYGNIIEMSDEVIELLKNDEKRILLGKNSKELINNDFIWKDYIYDLLDYVGSPMKKISVIVPNYNYSSYLEKRLLSIESQNYPIYELIYLDDCSSDNSKEVFRSFSLSSKKDIKFFENTINSGSVFKQWAKGIENVSGDYIWIAEADDFSDDNFLSTVVEGFNNDDVVLSYSQSKQIDESGNLLSDNYLDYTNDISLTKWKKDYINNGINELSTALVVKNTIPNVSGVVFKKFEIKDYLDEILTYKVAGDLFLYAKLLEKGSIAYFSKSLNYHRRHTNSVTHSEKNNKKHYEEIVKMQDMIKSITNISSDTNKKCSEYLGKVKEYLKVND